MCLSKAYIDWDGNRELLMEEVASLNVDGGKLMLRTLFGEQRVVGASIKQVDFMTHSILLEHLEERGDSLKGRHLG